jgi:hypothetical protein
MKVRNIIFNLAICVATLFFGLAWVGVYRFLSLENQNSINGKYCHYAAEETTAFDINNPNSVLPLNFEEDKLTSPKTDEMNEASFDPEGYYYFLDEAPNGFEDFRQFNIFNKNFDVNPKGRNYGELITPSGSMILLDHKKGTYIRFENLEISNGKIHFQAKSKNGISYEFDGEFLIKGNFYTLDENAKVLEGVLSKKEYGKTVAESRVTFGWGLDF